MLFWPAPILTSAGASLEITMRHRLRDPGRSTTRVAAFTIFELLAVITLITVLLTLLVPALRSARETGRKVVPIIADTTSRESVDNLVKSAADILGRGTDILVNNAATPGGLVLGPLAESDEADLMADIDTKVVGYFRCAKAVAPHMQSQGWGRIINIGGLSARRAGTFSGMRNAALVHFTKTLSDQLGPNGITANLVHPGSTRTERTDSEQEDRAAQTTSTRRMVDASEIGYVVTFLASTRATAITGETIAAGGGMPGVVYQ